MEQIQQLSFEPHCREAKKYVERLLLERSRCYDRIRSIDSKLLTLSTKYGLHLDMDENALVE